MQCVLEEGGSDQTNLMRWREATRELFLKITVKCNCRVLVSAMAGLKRAAPSIETSDEVPLFASRNVDSYDKPRIEVLTARDRVEDSDDDVPVFTPGKHGPTTPPTAATAPVRKEDPLQAIQETRRLATGAVGRPICSCETYKARNVIHLWRKICRNK